MIINQGGGEAAAMPAPGVSTWDFIRMLLVLSGVILLIYLIYRLLKRGSRVRQLDAQLIRLLDTRSLAGNRALHLVEVGRSIYLVGSAENGVNLVSTVEDKETLDTLRLALSERPALEKRGFAEVFFGLFKAEPGRSVTMKDTLNFMKGQKERLKRLQ